MFRRRSSKRKTAVEEGRKAGGVPGGVERQRHQQRGRADVAQRHSLRRQLAEHDVQDGDGEERDGEPTARGAE
jgi:hypothetical protein